MHQWNKNQGLYNYMDSSLASFGFLKMHCCQLLYKQYYCMFLGNHGGISSIYTYQTSNICGVIFETAIVETTPRLGTRQSDYG